MTVRWRDITAITPAKAESDIIILLQNVGFLAETWQEGDFGTLGVKVGGLIWSSLSQIAVALRDAGRNATASGDGLTTFADSHYDNQRTDAIAAQYRVTLACEVGEGPHTFAVGDLTLQASATGTTYVNIEASDSYPITLTGGSTVDVTIRAEEPGADASVAPSLIDTIVTTYAGVSIDTVTQLVIGVDEESDDSLRARNSSKWALLSEGDGIDDLVEQVCRAANSEIAQVAVDSSNPDGPGTFRVYCAGTVGTASGAAISDAQDALDARFFWGPTAIAAPTTALDISGEIYYDNNYSAVDVEAAVESALLAWLETIPLGGFDYASGFSDIIPVNNIEKIISSAEIDGIEVVGTVTLTTPAADVSVASFGKVVQGTWGFILTPITG